MSDPYKSGNTKLGNLFARLGGYDFIADEKLAGMTEEEREAEARKRKSARNTSTKDFLNYISDAYFEKDAVGNLQEKRKKRKDEEDTLLRYNRIKAMAMSDPSLDQATRNYILSSKEGLDAYEKERMQFGVKAMYNKLKLGNVNQSMNRNQFNIVSKMDPSMANLTYEDYLNLPPSQKATINEFFTQSIKSATNPTGQFPENSKFGLNERQQEFIDNYEKLDFLDKILRDSLSQ